MKYIFLFLVLTVTGIPNYSQIIADHTVVDRYDDIPQDYIDKVKEMWLVYAGESHSGAIRVGLELLESSNSLYDVNITSTGTPEGFTASHLRASRATWGDYSNSSGWIYSFGEEDWYTNSTAISRTKAGLLYCHNNNLTVSAFGYGWCWDPHDGGPSTGVDPVYGCHWYGASKNGPLGNLPWGIDDGDNSVSGNTINMGSYITATQAYIDYCASNGIPTKVFFTTGPVDDYAGSIPSEAMYQGHLKYERVRDYVKADAKRILFDYADILCYDSGNTNPSTATWNGYVYPTITPANELPTVASYHISQIGALRLAKAMWWMLARIAGWDGISTGSEHQVGSYFDIFKYMILPGELRIQIMDPLQSSTVSLYSLNGDLIGFFQPQSDYLIINTSPYSPGIYIINVQTDKSSQSKKIVIT